MRDTGTVFDGADRARPGAGRADHRTPTTPSARSRPRTAALAETFQIFPTFQRESRATLDAPRQFQANTEPLIQDLIPVAHDISPTLRSVRELSPEPRATCSRTSTPLICASRRPGSRRCATSSTGWRRCSIALDPFLANLNPVVALPELVPPHGHRLPREPPARPRGTLPPEPGQRPRATTCARRSTSRETLAHPAAATRRPTAATATSQPLSLNGFQSASGGIFPNFDCKPSGGETLNATVSSAPCVIAPKYPSEFGGGQAPQLYSDP